MRNNATKICVGAAAVWMAICAVTPTMSALAADEAMLPLWRPGAFTENYLDQPPQGPRRGGVVGATLVGLRIDAPDSAFDPASLRVRLGHAPTEANAHLCFRLTSRDGRYFAKGQYQPRPAPGPAPGLIFHSSYGGVLAGYAARDLAPIAFLGPGCDAVSGELVVSQSTAGGSQDRLIVQLRAGEARVRVQLLQGAAPLGKATICTPYAEGATVGFTSECALSLPPGLPSGGYTLAVGETSTSGDIKVQSYALRLWNGQ